MKIHFIACLFAGLTLATACKQDPEEPAVVPQVSVSDASMFEGSGSSKIAFTVSLSAATTNEVTVTYVTAAGTALAGTDFVEASGSVTIAPGALTQVIEITLVGDSLREGDERFSISLTSARNAILSQTSATGTITNDDTFLLIEDVGYSTPSSYAGKTLVWADEFSNSSLSMTDWTFEVGTGCPNLCGWGNNELQFYTGRKENTYLTQGKLVIEARKESYSGSSYTSSRIISRGKRYFKYGRIDIRAKLPEGQGIWPALWMLPNGSVYGWPKGGEIDIMELVGHMPSISHGTVHYASASSNQQRSISKSFALTGGKKYSDEFHVFSIDWKQDTITIFVDDKSFSQITRTTVEASGGFYPFNEPFFFIMNVAVGGNWPGNPNASTVFPQPMVVDYVRVFQ